MHVLILAFMVIIVNCFRSHFGALFHDYIKLTGLLSKHPGLLTLNAPMATKVVCFSKFKGTGDGCLFLTLINPLKNRLNGPRDTLF